MINLEDYKYCENYHLDTFINIQVTSHEELYDLKWREIERLGVAGFVTHGDRGLLPGPRGQRAGEVGLQLAPLGLQAVWGLDLGQSWAV